MRRWLTVFVVVIGLAGCGGDDGSTAAVDTTTTEAAASEADEGTDSNDESTDETEADTEDPAADDGVPDEEGSEACLLEPDEVADMTGVDGWEITEVAPHPTVENRATCRYESGDAEMVIGRLEAPAALDAYYEVTTVCEPDSIVESPREVGFFTFVCTTEGTRLGAGTADDTLITLEVLVDGEEPADEVYFELMKSALGF